MYILIDITQDIVEATENAQQWSSIVGLGIMASIMAIALIKFLYDIN